MPLAARSKQTVASTRPVGGWHPTEWACELAGTALLLVGGLSAICLDFGAGSHVAKILPDRSARFLLTGLLFSGSGAIVTISPIGRRSGAHLNPAVTFGFWCRHRVHVHDLAGYVVAQCIGAAIGTALVVWWWGSTARSVDFGVTTPGTGVDSWAAVAIEVLMTGLLVLTILLMVSSKATAHWTPLVVWLVIAALVWQGAPLTGTSLNPARSLAPALLLPDLTHLWIYLLAPPLGALAAAGIILSLRGIEPMTAKLYHDASYPSTFGSLLPTPARP